MKARDAIRIIERDDWRIVNQEAVTVDSNIPSRDRVTVAGPPSMDLDQRRRSGTEMRYAVLFEKTKTGYTRMCRICRDASPRDLRSKK
jgi:hypothetical protein